MDQSPDTFIVKLPTATIDKYLILKSVWLPDCITLDLVDLRNSANCNEWTGTIALSYLESSAVALEIPYDDFYAETKRALTTNHGVEHFEYDVTETGEFTLQKIDDCPMLYGRATLHRQPGLLHHMLLESVDTIATSRTALTAKQLDIQKLDMEFKLLAQLYEKSNVAKCTNETEIMKKCVSLLNAKKRKIAELQELLEEGKRFREEVARSKSPAVEERGGDRDCAEDQRLTQPMPMLVDTQRAVPTLPKRMKYQQESVGRAATMDAGPQHSVGRATAVDVGRTTTERLVEPSGGSSSEKAMNSEELFDAMMR